MGSEKIKVLVIDDGNEVRKQAIIDAFREPTQIYRLNCQTSCVETDQKEMGYWESLPNQIPFFNLILVHGQEFDLANQFDSYMVVGYGGYEGHDLRLQDADYQIYRAIHGKENIPTPIEINELIQFVTHKKKTKLPAFFFNENYDSEIEEWVGFINNSLLYPVGINWDEIIENHGGKFKKNDPAWEVFLNKVKNIRNGKASIEPDDSEYQAALMELIDKTINRKT